MDIKKRVKNVKKKLKDLGYEVKHTHCREVFAIAHGYRNAHQLPDRDKTLSKAMDVFLPKELHLTLKTMPNTTNEYYGEKIYGVKVFLNQLDINNLIETRDFIRDRDFSVDLKIGVIAPFENFDEDYFDSEDALDDFKNSLDDGDVSFEKEIYSKENCFLYDGESFSHIQATYEGIYIVTSIADKYQEVIFSTYCISWDDLELEKKS